MKYEARITDENGATSFIARDGIENTLSALREWMWQNIEAAQPRVQSDVVIAPCPNCSDDLFRCPACQEAYLARNAANA